jgi:hypothetical protein
MTINTHGPLNRYLVAAVCLAASGLATDGYAEAPWGAHAASICEQAVKCPLFDDVYANTPPFRHALSLSLRHGKEEVPEWVKVKLGQNRNDTHRNDALQGNDANRIVTASPMLPLRIDDRIYLLGNMADPQNAQHRIAALYDTTRGFATVYYTNEKGEGAFYGDTTDVLRRVMTDYLNRDTPFSHTVNSTDVTLPIPVSSQ